MDSRALLREAILCTWRVGCGLKTLWRMDLAGQDGPGVGQELLGHFCFPEPVLSSAEASHENQSWPSCLEQLRPGGPKQVFTFALVGGKGERKHGMAMRYVRAGNTMPECIGITSGVPWFEFLHAVLKNANHLLASGSSALVDRNLEPTKDCIQRVESFFLQLSNSIAMAQESHALKAGQCLGLGDGKVNEKPLPFPMKTPKDRGLGVDCAEIDLVPLLWQLSPENVAFLLGAILLEKRIVVMSDNIELLTSCVYICTAIIFPLDWQHVFLPLLPGKFCEYLSAPVPFLMGVPKTVWRQMPTNQRNSSAVLVDLDSGQVGGDLQGHALQSMPRKCTQNLLQRLKAMSASLAGPKSCADSWANEAVLSAFLQFYVNLLGSYQRFIRSDPYGQKSRQGTTNERKGFWFDSHGFLQAQEKGDLPFLSQFIETQCFEKFIFDRLEQVGSDYASTCRFEHEVGVHSRREKQSAALAYSESAWTGLTDWTSVCQPFIGTTMLGSTNSSAGTHTEIAKAESAGSNVNGADVPHLRTTSLMDMDMHAHALPEEQHCSVIESSCDPGKYLSKLLGLE